VTKFHNYLPQGDDASQKERQESYDKAVAEAKERQANKVDEVSLALERKDWLTKFKRVWSNGEVSSNPK
jgi:hypothetical protein